MHVPPPALAVVLRTIAPACFLALLSVSSATADQSAPVSYVRDVRPILASKCWHCHGPDGEARQAELRLDVPDGLTQAAGGPAVLVPGKPAESELYRRLTTADPAERMPPSDEPRQLTDAEVEVLRRWIEQGARFETHWSFLPPQRTSQPALKSGGEWLRTPVDGFVLQRAHEQNLAPAAEADKATLIRRVTLDLTGLPPSTEEVQAFVNDSSPDAYERVVDRLLASPRYGERLALWWLDAARYADSGGYQGDILRSMWRWRDWLIEAFNRGLPFDQFTIEQLAGDLLPNATIDQRIATGFHRNHRINDEDGIILEEFRVEYVADRAETTATVWLGLTLGCARCHDHKYDPISQREYYQLFAYFNSIAEEGRGNGNAPPVLQFPSPELQQKLASLDQAIAAVRDKLMLLAAAGNANEAPREQLQQQLAALQKERIDLAKTVPTTMVLQELDRPRDTFVLLRGGYDKPGAKVSPGFPQALRLSGSDYPPNRLGLARWLVDPRHPLTSRVTVNRVWQMLFGRGLVETSEDFGTQGQLPSHPDVLDWLACEFAETWDLKRLIRSIVTSATYRQSSAGTKEQFERDPTNRWLTRGPRFRMPAELIRDQALAASGLLVERLGGPSVRPYQPDGIWRELVSADLEYNQGHGSDLYRRSLYTFIRRTVPPPAMTALDAPNREICQVRRARTNTPLQALVLMNDPTYLEASRALAERALRESKTDVPSRLDTLFRLLLARSPIAAEQEVLTASLYFFRSRFAADPEQARQLTTVGESRADSRIAVDELAAYTAVASLLMNLDETMTKE